MKLSWQSPITWMLAGVLVIIIAAVIGQLGDNGEAINPLGVVGVVLLLIGAFTWAIRRGLDSSGRD